MAARARFSSSLAAWSLTALLAGLVLGVVGQSTGGAWASGLSAVLSPLGTVWMNALQLAVIPLVVTQLLAAMVGAEVPSRVGSLGVGSLVLFVLFLVGAGLLTVTGTPFLLGLYTPSPELVEALRGSVATDALPPMAAGEPVSGFGDWLVALVPTNVFASAAEGQILQLLVATVIFGAAASRLPDERRRPLAEVFRSLADAMMVVVGWVLQGTPVGVLALIFALSLQTGLDVVGVVGAYVIMLSGVLVLATLALYPLTVALGKTDLATFARAVAPAQIVAMGTQSSLASLPALIEGGERELDLPAESTSFVLPLSVSTFKINQAIYPPFALLFLAYVFGVHVSNADLAAFLVYSILASFSVPGVPRGGGAGTTIAILLAMGIPIEGVVLIEAVKTIPDVFMTLVNVTADMSGATVLSRDRRAAASGAGPGSPSTPPSDEPEQRVA